MSNSKEDIKGDCLYKYVDEWQEDASPYPEEVIYKAMDDYASIRSREEAIAFFKWYAVKMVNFLHYIKDIRPIVQSEEIEEKIREFEGQPIEKLFELYEASKTSQPIENQNPNNP